MAKLQTMVPVQIHDVFKPIIGLHAWQVRQGHGSFLTLEFGKPHLRIREPKLNISSELDSVKELFRRRKVIVAGEWHLWIQYAKWKIETENDHVSDLEEDRNVVMKVLEELDGQILLGVEVNVPEQFIMLNFDLGPKLRMFPSPHFPDDDWCSIHQISGSITSISVRDDAFECTVE
jgi:hypothetical protein